MSKKKPNIIIFNPDEFRAGALCHLGNDASQTPNFDDICVNDGVSFRNAFCQNPVCTPSRCSFMSGWYPHVRGHRTMHNMIHKDEPVLLKTLKDNGYFVWWGGKNDLIPGQDPEIFSEYCDVKYKKTKELRKNLHDDLTWRGNEESDNYYSFYAGKLDKKQEDVYYDSDWDYVYGAIEFIKNYDGKKPFCIYLPLSYPHPPYGVEEPWYSSIDKKKLDERIKIDNWDLKPSILKGIKERQKLNGWTEERWDELRAVYLGMCSRIDYQFGLIVDAIKEKKLYDDTAVFVFSDHGDYSGDYGIVEKNQNTFEDALTNVPFIIKPPANIKIKAGINDALVELLDFPATVSDITGIDLEQNHFGKSLIPLIKGDVNEHKDAVFCEGGRLHDEVQCMEMQSVNDQSTDGLYYPRLSLQRSEGPEHGKAVMCRTKDFKYVNRLYELDEFYDLKKDPKEINNVINDIAYTNVINEMKQRMLKFFMETSDVVPLKTDKR
ncbi:MAG: sulfatase-like hydrolase/transferase [Clostridiaceae bacterium]